MAGPGGLAVWPAFDLAIPETSPAAVAMPAYRAWGELARANRALLDRAMTPLGGVRLGALRREARAEVLALASQYTASLRVPVASRPSEVVLATGHQPLLVHPGIWVKYLALARAVPPEGTGLNVIVDSDAADEVAAEIPRADGRLRRDRLRLADGGPDHPIEAIPVPQPAAWRAFVAAVDERLATIDEPAVRAGWERARRLLPPEAGPDLGGAVTAVRRALEGPRPYVDLPVSRLAGTRAFRRFAVALLADAPRFATIHNRCLAGYREHYGVRTAAQPFPDLTVEETLVEVPFWLVEAGRRWPVFVQPASGALVASGRTVGEVPADPDAPGFAALPLRPRALTLTAFVRLVVADLFIHGVGGGRYDRATDAIIREWLGLAPPAYVAVTATLHLPFDGAGSIDAERQRLRRLLLDLQHNPDRFLPDGGPHRGLVEEKWDLIRRLERAGEMTRRERRAATQRIRELNTILAAVVADRVAETQEALARLDRHDEDAEVRAYRGYPFLLYPIEAVEALVDSLAAAGPVPGPGT
ncbi:MAG: hypothetical protein QN174_09645 [Armatimonadota bacterium]|nr:hypothetical protein [Armatimonadota bacterium]MDR7422801.1 hypothetical protein [Armatimonadota bacterium]MDR7453339.1 hypothetical protein [Armatimonadota bacterium]MDR7457025.1 hypothetical protein [Armatimonadota bacterium]MDR7497207.1 hypothetical protein [Armatimonadota bacterium]